MKKLSINLFLILLIFSNSIYADDIQDLQIEGISIGNSLLDYLSKDEIINATRILKRKKGNVSIKNFEKNLHTHGIPNPDLLIRTGGKKRLSNFLLWQLAYSELYFLDKLWPDFTVTDYHKIIRHFKGVKRNFGNI